MPRCTAPIYGHRTASGRANCPVCGGGYRNYIHYPTYPSSYSPSYSSLTSNAKSSSNGGKSKKKAS